MKPSNAGTRTSKSDSKVIVSSPYSLFTKTIRHATSLIKGVGGYSAAIAGVIIAIKTLPQRVGLPVGSCAALFLSPIILTFCFGTLPEFLDKRRRERLKMIRGTLKPGYFQLSPRENEESFQRADGKHVDVLAWLSNPPRRLLYLTGASGAGKSSLLSAWVIPKLRRAGTRVIRLRGFQDPAHALETELKRSGYQNTTQRDDLNLLVQASEKQSHPNRLLIVFDQFEEFLILKEAPERQRFLEFLRTQAEEQNGNATILLVFRDEYDTFIHELKLPTPVYDDNLKKVSKFTEAVAQDFLLGSGLRFDEQLQGSVLREAAEVEGTRGLIRPITINLCGLVLSRFKTGVPPQFSPGRMIRGFVEESIFQKQLADVSPRFLPKLISAHVTKVPQSVETLSEGTGLTSEEVRGAMFRLADPDRGIVRPLDDNYQVWEISHDFLVPILDSILAQWHSKWWRAVRPWLPVAAAVIIGTVVVAVPRILPDPVGDLTGKGWNINSEWNSPTEPHFLVYNLGCHGCTTDELQSSTWDLHRLGGELNLTLDDITTFDSTHFYSWSGLNIKNLSFSSNSRLNDITAVANIQSLWRLDLNQAVKVPDVQLRNLPKSLGSLNIAGTRVSDATIRHLPRGLSFLNLDGTSITNAGIRDLPPDLDSLDLDKTGVTDVGLKHLPTSLQHLGLGGTGVTDAGIVDLPDGVTSLYLYETRVSDSAIKSLPKSLQFVDLTDTQVTIRGMKALPPSVKAIAARPPAPTFTGVVVSR